MRKKTEYMQITLFFLLRIANLKCFGFQENK
jgi:hypothetical protein